MKPGYLTTEFWVTLASSLWGIFGTSAPPTVKVIAPAVLGAFYAISRGLAKHGDIIEAPKAP